MKAPTPKPWYADPAEIDRLYEYLTFRGYPVASYSRFIRDAAQYEDERQDMLEAEWRASL